LTKSHEANCQIPVKLIQAGVLLMMGA
jgi:hypothetical protein